jgi:hypothetical protein
MIIHQPPEGRRDIGEAEQREPEPEVDASLSRIDSILVATGSPADQADDLPLDRAPGGVTGLPTARTLLELARVARYARARPQAAPAGG